MKFQNKKHLTLTLKKKSGAPLLADEVKELIELDAKSEEDKKKEDDAKAAEDKKKEEDAKAAAAKEEEDKKKPAPEKKEGEPTTDGAVTMETLGAQIAALTENMNMLMEALATMMDAGAPAEEAKADEPKEEPKEETEEEETEQTEEEMEEELEKTLAELEAIA